jgi:homoserine kinase type II
MMAKTTLSPLEITEIAAAYAVVPLSSSKVTAGMTNSTYLLSTADAQYILTALDGHTPSSAAELADLMSQLYLYHPDVPTIVLTSDGELLLTRNGHCFMMKNYVTGTHPDPKSQADCYAVGAALAHAHEVYEPLKALSRRRSLPGNYVEFLAPCDDRSFTDWLHRAHQDYELAAPGLPIGLIHGDLFPDNILLGKDGRIHILDWETAGVEALVLDLALCVTGFMLAGAADASDIIAGYESRRPLLQIEREIFSVCFEYACAILSYHRYVRHHIIWPDPATANLYKDLQHWCEDTMARASLSVATGLIPPPSL